MDSFVQFLGRLHPLIVHLPIGIFVLLGLLELGGLASRWRAFAHFPRLAPAQRRVIAGLCALSSVVSVVFGWLLASDGDYDATLLDRHRLLGLITAALACGVFMATQPDRSRAYAGLLVLALVALTLAGHLGGSLTHGSDYLTHAFAASAADASSANAASLAKAGPADLTLFAAAIQPIFEQRCVACHGPEKSNGKLRLDSWGGLATGGKNGPVFIEGDSAHSLLIKRLHLPLEEKKRMPPKGKPQLTDDDRQLLAWWVDARPSPDQTLATLTPPPAIAAILAARLGTSREPAPALPDREQMLVAAAELERSLGIVVTPLSRDEPWLQANARFQAARFDDTALARLAAIAPALRWLDLGETGVTDAGLVHLAGMPHLRRLQLDRTAVTDAGLAQLAPLAGLEHLSLHHTKVTNHGLAVLRPLTQLSSLYVWQTAVTPEAAEEFRAAATDSLQVQRWHSEIAAIQDKIRQQHVTVNLGAPAAPAFTTPAAKPRSAPTTSPTATTAEEEEAQP